MSKVGVFTVLATALCATPVLAQTGDIWNGTTNIGSVSNVILHPDQFLSLLANLSSSSYEVSGSRYDITKANDIFVNNPTLTVAQLQAKITTDVVGTPIAQGLTVASVSAINTNSAVVALDGATTVQANATFSVVMGAGIDSTTVTSANVKLYSVSSTGVATQVGLTGIALDTKDTTNMTIVAKPATYLTKASSYKLVLTTGLKDKTGLMLAANKEISFTTDSSSVVVANGLSTDTGVLAAGNNVPGADLVAGKMFTIKYDTTLDDASVNNTNVRVKDLTTAAYIPYAASVVTTTATNDTIKLVWSSAAPLVAGHKYQIEISNVKTAAGNSVANNVIGFVANDSAISAISALTAKDVTDNLATGARLYPKLTSGLYAGTYKQGAGLVVTLNKVADPTTVTASNVFLTVKGSTVVVPTTIVYNKDESATTSILRITPSADLTEGTLYTLHIGTGVKTLAGTAVATEILSADIKTADLTAPTILSVDGTDNLQANVASKIVVHFSEPIVFERVAGGVGASVIGTAAIAGTAISVDNPISITNVTANGADGGASGIFGSAQLSTDSKDLTLTVTPAAVNTVYRIRLAAKNATTPSAYITDTNNAIVGGTTGVNNSIAAAYDIVATTAADTAKPAITAVSDTTISGAAIIPNVTNVPNTKVFAFKTNKTLNALTGATYTLTNLTTGVAATIGGANNASLTASNVGSFGQILLTLPGAFAPYTADGKYELSINGLQDAAGANIQTVAYKFGFTVDATLTAVLDTTPATQSHVFTADTVADGVLKLADDAVAVVGNTTNALVNTPVYLKFNEAVTGLSSTSVVLTNDVTGTVVPATVVADADNLGVTVTPTANLAAGTAYRVTVAKTLVSDIAGNPLAADKVIRFKTAAAATVPTVTYSVKAFNGVDNNTLRRDGGIVLTFNGVAGAAAANTATYTLTDTTAPGTIAVKAVVSTDNKSVTLYPDTVLASGDAYTIAVAGTLTVDSVALNTNALNVLSQAFTADTNVTADATTSTGVESATFDATKKTLVITFDRLVDPTTGKDLAKYTITGGTVVAIGTAGSEGIVSGNTVTFVLDTSATGSVIVPGVTTIAAKATVLSTASASTPAFGTVAATVK